MNAAQAFIAFLRCEAIQAEERAKSLRATAATIEANAYGGKKKKRKRETNDGSSFGVTTTTAPTGAVAETEAGRTSVTSGGTNSGSNSMRPKRAHTAYTLFVHENYEMIRQTQEDMQLKDIISLVGQQWAQTSEEEKEIWRYRADQLKDSDVSVTFVPELEDIVGLPEPSSTTGTGTTRNVKMDEGGFPTTRTAPSSSGQQHQQQPHHHPYHSPH